MKKREEKKSAKETILVIEDDQSLRQGLVMNFELRGYRVLSADDGQVGMQMAFDARPDLIVLDIMLPGFNGLEILSELRTRDENVPVLILSARDTTNNKIQGLDLGADDYVTKPFELPELLARIEVMLRRNRTKRTKEPILAFGKVVIDPTIRQVKVASRNIKLSAKEFDMLYLLASSPDRVFSRDEILNCVWGWDFEGTSRTVDNYILSLRQKIEADPSHPNHIKTVRQVGYRLEH